MLTLFFFGHTAQHVKLPQPGTEPCAPCTEHLRVWTTRKVKKCLLLSVQLSLSRVQLCDPMTCSTPGLPVHHQLPEFTQTHVHWVDDAIQPSHPLSFPSPPTFNLSQHQDLLPMSQLFTPGGQSIGQSIQLQHQSFQWTPRTDFL